MHIQGRMFSSPTFRDNEIVFEHSFFFFFAKYYFRAFSVKGMRHAIVAINYGLALLSGMLSIY